MKRNRKIVVLCHCLLNSNAKVAGLAQYGGAFAPQVEKCLASGAGIIQLPCPETTYLGLQRWGMTRNQYDTPFYRRHCRNLLAPYLDQILEYREHGYHIEEVVGVDGSPSCGVHVTCEGYCGGLVDDQPSPSIQQVAGKGVFLGELFAMLQENDIALPFSAIDENNPR